MMMFWCRWLTTSATLLFVVLSASPRCCLARSPSLFACRGGARGGESGWSQRKAPSSSSPSSSSSSILLGLRGGAVEEPLSLDDVKALLLRAGAEQKLVVIDFTATWCGPCKMIAPLFQELSDLHENVIFVKVDVDQNPDTAAAYNVSAMPTFVFIKGGQVVERLSGANPSRLQELVQEYQ